MHWARFVVFNAIGAALWVATWTCIGYFSGSHIDTIYDTASRYSTYLAITVAVLLLTYVVRRLARGRRARAGSAASPAPAAGLSECEHVGLGRRLEERDLKRGLAHHYGVERSAASGSSNASPAAPTAAHRPRRLHVKVRGTRPSALRR